MNDLVTDTAKKMGVEPKALFLKASERFTNSDEVANYRFERWFKFGELPSFIETFLLQHWSPTGEPYPLPGVPCSIQSRRTSYQ